MKLYGYFRSSAAYRVRIALNLKGVEVEHLPVHLVKDGGQHKLPGYLKRNPQGLVPALELDDGTVLTQSLAIIEYLDSFNTGQQLIPRDPILAAKARAVAQIITCEIHPLNNLRVLNYLKGPLQQSQESIEKWMQHWTLSGGLEAVETLLSGDEFCFGKSPTIADCCLIPQLFNARRFKIAFNHLPKISRVENNCMSLVAFTTAQPSAQADAE